MSIRMYDLAGANPAVRFSPYCWRIRMALAHKGLDVETIPWRFSDKEVIAFSGQGLVPVIRDGDTIVHDSWAIAEYLDTTYPDRPMLMEGEQGRALASFVRHYAQNVLSGPLLKAVLLDIYAALDERDKPYFRESREKRFGMPMEQFAVAPDVAAAQLSQGLSPLRALLKEQPFINGKHAAFADYCVFGAFMWARNASDAKLIAEDDPVYAWRERMLDLFDGLARKSPRAKT
jgi:glutathione S-transferase